MRREACSTDTSPRSDIVFEHGYLVDRGVRPFSLIGHCKASPDEMGRAMTILSSAGASQLVSIDAIPFVIDRGDGVADYGFASHAWVIDLYRWLTRAPASVVPPQHLHRIIGLMLGYSADAIRAHDERIRFTTPGT